MQHRPKGFHSDVVHIWDLVVGKSGIVTHVNKPNGELNGVDENMMMNFAESGHGSEELSISGAVADLRNELLDVQCG